MSRSACLSSVVFCVVLVGCGAQHHARHEFKPTGAPTLPSFGSRDDEERAQVMAMALVQARPKRNHPHDRFLVSTEAYSNTSTTYEDTAQGYLLGRGHPYSENLNYEVKLVLELAAHHRLRVASYHERAIDVPPAREER